MSDVNKAVDILLVEDNHNDVRRALSVLKENGIEDKILVLRDGQEALDFLLCRGAYDGRDRANRPKVILLDLKLPKIDGLEVLKTIKTDPRTRSIPVVVLTSSQHDKDMVQSYHLGSNSYVVKPIDFAEYRRSIQDLRLYWLIRNKTPTSEPA